MNEIFERLKYDKNLRIILLMLGLSLILVFVGFRIIFPPAPKLPCFKTKLTVWTPFNAYYLSQILSSFSKYCVSFNIQEKSLEEIKQDLIYSLAQGNPPDIVYLPSDYLKENEKFFATSTLVNIDTLVLYYNIPVLDILKLQPPRNLNELKEFNKKIKENSSIDLYSTALGTLEVQNRKEIILSLATLKEKYQSNFKEALIFALDEYLSYSDPQKENFVYPAGAGYDLKNFAEEKLATYIGFYQDKKEILKINPKLNFGVTFYPLDTLPPKGKIYTEEFYFAVPKRAKKGVANFFLDWFLQERLKDFVNQFDLIPPKEIEGLSSEKKIVLDSYKNLKETFDFLNKEELFSQFDKLIYLWENNRNEGYKLLTNMKIYR